MSWPARKKLDCQALALAAAEPALWFATLIVLAGALLANILCWHFDLDGWPRDLLRSVPFILAAPGTATLRRRLIVRLIRAQVTDV